MPQPSIWEITLTEKPELNLICMKKLGHVKQTHYIIPEVTVDNGGPIRSGGVGWKPLNQLVHSRNVVGFARFVLLRPAANLSAHIVAWGRKEPSESELEFMQSDITQTLPHSFLQLYFLVSGFEQTAL